MGRFVAVTVTDAKPRRNTPANTAIASPGLVTRYACEPTLAPGGDSMNVDSVDPLLEITRRWALNQGHAFASLSIQWARADDLNSDGWSEPPGRLARRRAIAAWCAAHGPVTKGIDVRQVAYFKAAMRGQGAEAATAELRALLAVELLRANQ